VDAMSSFDTPPRVRVSFIGEQTSIYTLIQGGAPFIKLIDADENVSALREVTDSTWEIKELHRVLTKLKKDVASVGQFYKQEQSHGIWNVPVLWTRSHQLVMGYGTTYAAQDRPTTSSCRK